MPKLSLAWDGVTVKCLHSEPHLPDVNSGLVVSLAIAHQPIASPLLTSHLHLIVNPSEIDPNMAEQIQSMALPFNYSQTISNPSILYLIRLLQTEMQAPQPMNRVFVSSIVTVLATYLLQNFRLEQCEP